MRIPLLTFLLSCLALATAAQAGKIIFTDRGASIVRIANLDGTGLQTLIPSAGSNIRGIAIDVATDDLFYADNGADIIYHANLDGSGRSPIVSTGLGFPADIALDRAAGKIYWCDRNNNRIERSNYNGSDRETVVPNTTQPYYLDLDLVNGKLYWGDFSGGNIFRADLANGANQETLVDSNIQTRGVKVDPAGGYFYWCDRESHKVQRRKISGGLIEDLYTGLDTPHGMTLDIPAGKVYWVDTGTNNVGGTGARAVSRGDMDGSGTQEVLSNVNQPWDITLDMRVANYDQWIARRFHGSLAPGLHNPSADPDDDDLNNLEEYFANLDPLRAQNISPTRPVRFSSGIGTFGTEYRQAADIRTDVVATVEVSNDLRNWRSGDGVTMDEGFATFGDFRLAQVRAIPTGGDPASTYLRLRLQLAAP